MLPIKIKERIAQYYLPGSIGNYDQMITIEHFTSLFAPVEKITEPEINQALIDLNFTDESKLADNYLVIIAQQ